MKRNITLFVVAIALATMAGLAYRPIVKAEFVATAVPINPLTTLAAKINNVQLNVAKASYAAVVKNNKRPALDQGGYLTNPTPTLKSCPNSDSDHCIWICVDGGPLDNVDEKNPCSGNLCCPGCGSDDHEC